MKIIQVLIFKKPNNNWTFILLQNCNSLDWLIYVQKKNMLSHSFMSSFQKALNFHTFLLAVVWQAVLVKCVTIKCHETYYSWLFFVFAWPLTFFKLLVKLFVAPFFKLLVKLFVAPNTAFRILCPSLCFVDIWQIFIWYVFFLCRHSWTTPKYLIKASVKTITFMITFSRFVCGQADKKFVSSSEGSSAVGQRAHRSVSQSLCHSYQVSPNSLQLGTNFMN